MCSWGAATQAVEVQLARALHRGARQGTGALGAPSPTSRGHGCVAQPPTMSSCRSDLAWHTYTHRRTLASVEVAAVQSSQRLAGQNQLLKCHQVHCATVAANSRMSLALRNTLPTHTHSHSCCSGTFAKGWPHRAAAAADAQLWASHTAAHQPRSRCSQRVTVQVPHTHTSHNS